MSRNGSSFSRRSFLSGLAGAAGSAIGTRIAGRSWVGEALAAPTEPTALVMVQLGGGYNAIFGSADSLVGKFGVTATNHEVLLGGSAFDKSLSTAFSPIARKHVAVIGVKHGLSGHDAAARSLWSKNADNAGLILADALGGTAPIKAAYAGRTFDSQKAIFGDRFNGISFQPINDLASTIDTLRGGAAGVRAPKREIAIAGLEGAKDMSANALLGSPGSLSSVEDAFDAAIDTLKKPVATLDLAALQQAYALTGASVTSIASRFAAAELMVMSGSSVVSVFDNRWDTHGDNDGTVVRNKMKDLVTPLKTFLTRMIDGQPTRNVVVCLFGEFARDLPNSNHQPNLSVTVIGKYVKPGTTGRTDANVGLKAGTPTIPGMWAYLAAVTKASGSPFGANPHNLVL
jgi:uncharacterized protein DUF1501